MSAGVTPASAKARGPDHTAPVYVRSTLPPIWSLSASPAPSSRTRGRFRLRAISGATTTTAPPPSLITQQSRRWSGSVMIGELTTSSTVTTSRDRKSTRLNSSHLVISYAVFCLKKQIAVAGLVRMALRSPPLSSRARNWLGNACVIGFVFGSPLLLLLGNLSIYDEAIIWGLALSLGAIFFAFRSRQTEGSGLTHALLGFSLCAAGALLSRVTFGAPLILIAPFLALGLPSGNRIVNLTALVLPLAAALIFYIWLSYARFGNVTGVHFDYYINPVHSEFAHKFGVFSPRRLPYSFADYFSLRLPSLQREPPFLAAGRHSYNYPSLY